MATWTSITTYSDREFLFRLQTLVIDGGTEVVRNIFDQSLKNQPLNVFLANEKTTVNRLRGQKIITQTQYDLMYPKSGLPPSSKDFDITLIVCLLRNLPSLGLNQKYKWYIQPQSSDNTVEADITRLKGFRNDIAHASSTTGFTQTSFQTKWNEIEQVLLRLNSTMPNPLPNFKQTIDSYKHSPIDPAAEQELQKTMEQWREMEKGLESEIEQIKLDVSGTKQKMEDTNQRVEEVEKEVKKMKELPGPGRRRISGILRFFTSKFFGSGKKDNQWRDCLQIADKACQIESASALLDRKILPDQAQLRLAISVFGRCSETFLKICNAISEDIRKKSGDVIDVWAAYRYYENIKEEDIKPVFVVITKTGKLGIREKDFDIAEKGETVYSAESENALMEVEKDLAGEDKFPESKLTDLEHLASINADILMDNHKNLNIVSPSLKKSRQFGKADAEISDELCIALYVHIKGLIPIAEEPFPTKIGEFHTDVLEGGFRLFHGGPFDYHDQLKIGLAIHANIRDNKGDRIFGTLGGFLDNTSDGICALTCAHIVLTPYEMQQLITCNQMNFKKEDRKVFQSDSQAFGHLLSAFYRTGDINSSGIDAALIHIKQRHPKDGSFPAASNYVDAGFDESNQMVYSKGKVSPLHGIRRRAEVYKYGISTEVTRGSLGFRGALVKTSEMHVDNQPFVYRLHKQIEVLRIGDTCFALPGDSGALVFFDDTDDDSVAVGIVVGGHSNNRIVYVTPICEILKNIGGCVSMTKFIHDGSVSNDFGIAMDTS